MPKHSVHVTRASGGSRWRVSQGASTVSMHRTQSNAISRGRRDAMKDGVDLVTHGMDGRIRSISSFRNGSLQSLDLER